jgi:mannose-6-phosphate isomerase-like protein (cupin superfamily)
MIGNPGRVSISAMRATPILFLFTALISAGFGQTYTSAADIQKLIANAKKIRKGDQPTVSLPILKLAPYQPNLEYRAAVGPASIHEKEAEMFYVIDGAGTLVTGGKLVDERRTNASNLTGMAIEGGQSQAVSKGDFFIVPEKTPHWFSEIKGTLILMSFHIPRSE